ncbi:MAG: sigma-70 family RNA polymerase sigma factor, partial [Clostridia bacterium]|nr:sigma-70 family RNA polymerase sigma factor [Clostridia bacterium]
IAQEGKLIDRQKEILDRIQLVGNPVLIAVLTDKYINGMSIEKIAEAMNKSVRTICVWHGQALQIFRQETGLK